MPRIMPQPGAASGVSWLTAPQAARAQGSVSQERSNLQSGRVHTSHSKPLNQVKCIVHFHLKFSFNFVVNKNNSVIVNQDFFFKLSFLDNQKRKLNFPEVSLEH